MNSLWAAARPPIGPWCRPEDGLFGLLDGIVEDPAIEPIPDTSTPTPRWSSSFPDLALSTLRGYTAYQFANGAAVWSSAGGGSGPRAGTNDGRNRVRHADAGLPDHYERPVLRGPGGPLLAAHRERRALREFYPAVKGTPPTR